MENSRERRNKSRGDDFFGSSGKRAIEFCKPRISIESDES